MHVTATRKYKDALAGQPAEVATRFFNGPRWRLAASRENVDAAFPPGTDFSVESRFGSVESAVVMNDKGEPDFDRPLYREAPSCTIVAWGRDRRRNVRIGVVREARPHADDPERPGNEHAAVVFGQPPMGFLDKVLGKDLIERYESVESGAVRELGEEMGANVILSIETPPYPHHNPSPTFVATWCNIRFVEVDLERLGAMKLDRGEKIFSADFVLVRDLLRYIAKGTDETGAVYRSGISNSAWMVFFACRPEIFQEVPE